MVDSKIKKILFIPALLVFLLLLMGSSGLANANDLEKLPDVPILGEGGVLDRIFNYLFWIFIIAATISILVSGFYFITARGDPEKFRTAKMMVVYALIGILVAFSSRGLVFFIKNMVGTGEPTERTCSGWCASQGYGRGVCRDSAEGCAGGYHSGECPEQALIVVV